MYITIRSKKDFRKIIICYARKKYIIHPFIIRIIQLRSFWYSFGIPRVSNVSSTIANSRKHIFNSFKKIIFIDYAAKKEIIIILYLSKNY